jgi:hypothetical protein
VFFSKLYFENDTKEYHLTDDFRKNQVLALRAKHMIHPWDDMPRHITTFYFCSICKKWAHPIVSIGQKGIQNSYSMGTDKSMYNFSKSALVCGRQTLSVSIRKLKENGDYNRETTNKEKDARIIRKHKKNSFCSNTPLIPVDMLGIVKKLDGKLWVLCEICGCLIQFDGTKFTIQGVTCGNHTNYASEIQIMSTRNILYPHVKEKRCFYCNVSEKSKVLKMVKILEDTTEELLIKEYYVCGSEYDKIKYLTDTQLYIPRMSNVVRFIQKSKQKTLEYAQKLHVNRIIN